MTTLAGGDRPAQIPNERPRTMNSDSSTASWARAQRLARRYAVLDAEPLTSSAQADRVEADLSVLAQQITRIVATPDWWVDSTGQLHLP